MKLILFTGSHRLLLAKEIFGRYGRNKYVDLNYYFYEKNDEGKGFTYWTWDLEKVIAKNHTRLTNIEAVNEREYLKITSLLSIGLSIEESFELTFNINKDLVNG